MQLLTRSHTHSIAPAPRAPAPTSRSGAVATPPAATTTTFAVAQTPTQEQVTDEHGTVLGVWDRTSGLGWVLGADSLVSDGIDWFLACVRGLTPLDAVARRALAEVHAMDHH